MLKMYLHCTLKFKKLKTFLFSSIIIFLTTKINTYFTVKKLMQSKIKSSSTILYDVAFGVKKIFLLYKKIKKDINTDQEN